MRKYILVAAAAALTSPALADGRAPTAEEASSLKSSLNSAGFSSWSKIEFDDGKWEVDDAVHADGKTYDVDLSKADLSIIKKELED